MQNGSAQSNRNKSKACYASNKANGCHFDPYWRLPFEVMITEVEAFFVDKMQAKADILKALEAKELSKQQFDSKVKKGDARCQRHHRFVFPPGCFSELGEPICETELAPRVLMATEEETVRCIYRVNLFPKVYLKAERFRDGTHWNVNFCRPLESPVQVRHGYLPFEWTADELIKRFPNHAEMDEWDYTKSIEFRFPLNGCLMKLVGRFDSDLLRLWEVR